jgi:hypothetical protein
LGPHWGHLGGGGLATGTLGGCPSLLLLLLLTGYLCLLGFCFGGGVCGLVTTGGGGLEGIGLVGNS